MLAGLIAALRPRAPAARLVALSADPAWTSRVHQVEAQPRSPAAVWRALAGARLLVSGGGSLVQDVTSARSAVYYLGTMIAATARRVPVAIVGQGVGPLRRAWVRRLTAAAFSRAKLVSVRDHESARLLARLGVLAPVHVGADLALLVPTPVAARDRAQGLLQAAGLAPGVPTLALVPRPWPGLGGGEGLAEGAAAFCGAHGLQAAVLPFDRTHDREISERVAARCGGAVVRATDPHDLLAVITEAALVLTIRLHGLIFAAGHAVPAVAVAYDPKVVAFAADVGCADLLPPNAEAAAVRTALESVWAGRDQRRGALIAALPDLRRRAEEGVELLSQLLVGEAGR